jgi:hypothetical protein
LIFIDFLWSHITNSHGSQSITEGLFIIYIIKIILLHLRAISFNKHHITRGFNTTGVLVENMIDTRVSIITKHETFINLRSKHRRFRPLEKNISLTPKDPKVRYIGFVTS